MSNVTSLHSDSDHCHSIQNKHYILEAGSFRNTVFVLNIVTMERVLLNVGGITQVKPSSKIFMLQ
jgi:hypothetical protein